MKLALFDDHALGVVLDDRIVDIAAVVGPRIARAPVNERMPALISEFDSLKEQITAFARDAKGVPLAGRRLRAPLPRPGKMLFAQGNYRENTPEGSAPLNLFLKAPSSVLDPGGTIELTADDAAIFHHEAELAVVIGRRGRHVSAARAADLIFGYTCLIDVSARCVGRGQDLADKSPDTFCPLGPWITTKDEIEDPQRLAVRLWVDGRLRQDYGTDDMEHPVRDLISWGSQVLTLEPGDVLGCGTNHQGLGPLQDGESVAIEIDRIGRMELRVSDSLGRGWPVDVDRGIGEAVIKLRRTGIRPPPSELFPMRRIR